MGNSTAAVIYFSLDGNTRYLAQTIADAVGATVIEIKPEAAQKGKGSLKHIWGSTQVTLPEEPPIAPIEDDLQSYDLLFLGTPVWAGGVAPPVRTFIREREFFRRDFAVFASYSGRTGRVFQDFRKRLVGNEILGEIGVREPLEQQGQELEERIHAWAREMQKLQR